MTSAPPLTEQTYTGIVMAVKVNTNTYMEHRDKANRFLAVTVVYSLHGAGYLKS
jgi:hypothetical protein